MQAPAAVVLTDATAAAGYAAYVAATVIHVTDTAAASPVQLPLLSILLSQLQELLSLRQLQPWQMQLCVSLPMLPVAAHAADDCVTAPVSRAADVVPCTAAPVACVVVTAVTSVTSACAAACVAAAAITTA